MAIQVAGLGTNPQTTVPTPAPDLAPLQTAQTDLTATVERFEAQVVNLQADRDRNGFEAADRINLDLAGTTNATHQLLISTLRLDVDELKAAGKRAAEDVRMEGILRRAETTNRIAAVNDLAVQVVDLRTDLAQLKLDQETDSKSLGPLTAVGRAIQGILPDLGAEPGPWRELPLGAGSAPEGQRSPRVAPIDKLRRAARFRRPAGPQQEALH
jgi:hypothetical protein